MTAYTAPAGTPVRPPCCVGCGKVHGDDTTPAWKIRCEECFATKRRAWYCKWDGIPIESTKREYAQKMGGEATQCKMCSKVGPRIPR